MEPKGKTSFIPKKPVTNDKGGGSSATQSILFVITFIIFILSLMGAGGVYFYKGYLKDQISQKKQYLEESKQAFEPSLIQELKTLDTRMQISERVLGNHVAPSVIFSILERNTLKTVRFEEMKFEYSKGSPVLKMQGDASGFNSIALQSDIFGEHDLFKNPVFSSLNVNDTGRVGFKFSSGLNVEDLLYEENLGRDYYQDSPSAGSTSDNPREAGNGASATSSPVEEFN